jgi:hypothetical protein
MSQWRIVVALILLCGVFAGARAAGAGVASCVGDCDGTGSVTVDKLVTMVSIALGEAELSSCDDGDNDGNLQITVDEILIALNMALNGCYELGSCDDPAMQAEEPLCALDHATVNCDFLVAEHCLLPFPSSTFLRPDPGTRTGLRVNIESEAMPLNRDRRRIDPAEYNTFDGFSPGAVLIAIFTEGVDLAASRTSPITNIARSLEEDSPTVLLDATTGERVLHFVELDEQATIPSKKTFMIRPGVRLSEMRRYIVAIRGLVDQQGNAVEARRPFAILRDQLDTPVETIEARRPAMEEIFAILAGAGVERDDLILAWDFTVASTESLTSRALSIRDQGLAANGPGAPPFEVTSVEEDVDSNILRRVRGVFTVPLFMQSAIPPTKMNLDANGVPVQNGTATAPFIVNIPRSAVADGVAHPARPVVYGHGLFGDGTEANAGHLRAFSNRVNVMFAGTDWIGMSEEDLMPVQRMIRDLSDFSIIPDRLQQAMLNFILLGRLLIAEDGFASHPAFQLDGAELMDRSELYYYGLSQGGIQGGTYLALSPDTKRGVLGVGASNYSILLQRSIDFIPFQFILNGFYGDQLDRALLYPLLQMVWDRAEPNGYLSHLVADPLPGSQAKKVLLQPGVNDSQVGSIGTEIQARSLGIPAMAPSALPAFGIAETEAPFDGSAYVPYDVGGVAPPLTNTPPTVENGVHEAVRRLTAAQDQIDAFLRPDGRVENFCGGACVFMDVPGVITE